MTIHIYKAQTNPLKRIPLEYPEVYEICGRVGNCCAHVTDIAFKRYTYDCVPCRPPCWGTVQTQPSKVVSINCKDSSTDFCCCKEGCASDDPCVKRV